MTRPAKPPKVERPDPHEPTTWSTKATPLADLRGGLVGSWLAELAVFTATFVVAPPTFHYRKYVPATINAWVEEFEYRSAIIEYEGGVPRPEAERLALTMIGPEPK